jgi:SPP1 gp7 family putative phage head morphogenesis protein
MENEIKESIEMPDRFSINENGEMTLQMNKEFRPNAIARTETIRLANEGLVSRYKKSDVQEVRFLAALSDRTCPICEDLNGRVFNIQEMETGTNQPPIHTNCRCTLVPVITWNQ